MYTGKLLGAIVGMGLGLALGSPAFAFALAIFGGIVGHRIDAANADVATRVPLPTSDAPLLDIPEPKSLAELEQEARAHFAQNVASLFAEVAREQQASEDVCTRAARFLLDNLAFTPEDVADLIAPDPPPLRPAGDAAELCREELSAPERMLLLDALYSLASHRGRLTQGVREALTRLAASLGLSEAEHASVARNYVSGRFSDYQLLGLSPHASDEEVKRAFRRLALLHHPDKVNHLGGTAVFRASETFRAIREAYEAILAERGA